MTRLTRLALDHTPITILLMLLVLVGGALGLRSLKQELVPDIEFPMATVVTVWPGASADEVTDAVTEPIEEALSDLVGIDVVSVQSQTSDSYATVMLNVDYGTSQDDLRDAINRELDGVELPEGAEAPEVLLLDFAAIPVAALSASGDLPVGELQALVERVVVPELEGIDGVGQVTLTGGGREELRITVDPEKMAAAGVTVEAIRGILAANNVSIPAGTLAAEGEAIPVVVDRTIAGAQDIRDLVVALPQPEAGGAGAPPPSVSQAAAAPPATTRRILVEEGQTLADLAERYAVDEDVIREANDLPVGEPAAGDELLVPVPESALVLPAIWSVLGAEVAADVTPDMMRLAGQDLPDAVDALTPEQLEGLPTATLRYVPAEIVLRQADDVRDRLVARISEPDEGETAPEPAAEAQAAPRVTIPGAVMLGDVATVERITQGADSLSRTDGVPSLGLLVGKEQAANTVEVVNDVEEALDDLAAEHPITFNTVFEQGSYIEESLAAVRNEGLLGAIFAIVVILFFLSFSVRSTLVIALSIPLSLLFAFLLMRWQGLTLNLLTLGGLTIAIGRVVDDAIVVLENVYRHTQRGEDRTQAVLGGTREVARAVTASTLVAVAVFLPLAFIGGLTKEFFQPFALTTTYALLGSLIAALTVVPVLARAFLRRDVLPAEHETWLQRLYTPILEWVLDHRWLTLTLSIVFFLVSLVPLRWIPQGFLPSFGEPAVSISASLPPGTDLATTDAFAKEVEALLFADEDIDMVETSVGRGDQQLGFYENGNPSQATFYATLATVEQDFIERLTEDEEIDVDALADRLRADLAEIVGARAITYSVSTAAMQGFSTDSFDMQIQSDDEAALREANDLVLAALRDPANWVEDDDWFSWGDDEDKDEDKDDDDSAVEDAEVPIINFRSNLTEARPQLSVTVDPTAAMARGLTAAQVGMALREVLEGADLGEVSIDDGQGGKLQATIAYPADTIDSPEALAAFNLPSPAGAVPLSDIATIQSRPGPLEITRIDGVRSAVLSGEITSDDTFGVMDQAQSIVDDLDLDELFGEDVVTVSAGTETGYQQDAFRDTAAALPVSILVVYLIMVVTFRSLVHPFTILLSLPFALSGAILALWATDRPLSITSLIGLMMLIGIVIANAIVLIDLTQQHRESGMDARTALVRAGRTRLRPILMTAAATVLALLPQALEITGKGGLIASELATTVIGGLVTSTLLTLIVIPVVYSLLDPLSRHGGDGGPAVYEPRPAPVPPVAPAVPAMPTVPADTFSPTVPADAVREETDRFPSGVV